MGRLFSSQLARDFKARLILVGRQERPEEFIHSLEAQGGKVIYLQSDITDVEKLGKSLEEAEKILGSVNGVLHTAGTADHGGWIVRRTKQDDENVFAAKIRGTEGLFSYFEDKDLDFFVNCSSLSTVVPAFGTVAYVAANSYLDAFATAKGRSYPVLSIAWCGLLEIGMAANGPQETNVQETEYALRPMEAWNVLQRVLLLGMPNTLVSKIELNDFIQHYMGKFGDRNLVEPESAIGEYVQERPLLSVLFEPPVTDTEKKLAAIWKTFFNLDSVGVKDDFFDLGGDSLQALIVCKRIHETLGVELFLSDFFQNPTIKDMAMKVEELLLPEMKLTKSIVI
jgi:acyl carrier protein